MSKFCLICTFILVSIFVTTTIYSDNSPGPNGERMGGSLDAAVHGDIERRHNVDPIKIHIHSIAYAHVDHHPTGDYTIAYQYELNAKGKQKWNGVNIEGKDSDIDEFTQGCIEEFNINSEYATNHLPGGAKWWDDWLDWRISSTIKSTEEIVVEGEDGKDKKIKTVKAIDNASMINGEYTPALPAPGEAEGNASPSSTEMPASSDSEEASNTPSVPDAPTNMSGYGYNGWVSLSWTDPSNNGGATLTDYEYRYSVVSGTYSEWTSWGNTNNLNSVYNLTNGVQYQFQVRAVNSIGESTASNTAYATPV